MSARTSPCVLAGWLLKSEKTTLPWFFTSPTGELTPSFCVLIRHNKNLEKHCGAAEARQATFRGMPAVEPEYCCMETEVRTT